MRSVSICASDVGRPLKHLNLIVANSSPSPPERGWRSGPLTLSIPQQAYGNANVSTSFSTPRQQGSEHPMVLERDDTGDLEVFIDFNVHPRARHTEGHAGDAFEVECQPTKT